MTLFNPEILSLEEDINYHQEQIAEAEERLDQIKVAQAYSDTAIASIEDCIQNIDPFYLPILRGHIESMFSVTNNEVKEVKGTDPQEEKPLTKEVTPEKEFGSFTYHQVTGRPDLRPDTLEDLAPNITYSSSGRAYVGFHDRGEAEEFRNSISEPSMLSDSETMNDFKYEVKFYCTKEFIEDIVDDWTPEQKAELDWQEQLVRCAPDIFYDPSTAKCYVGFSAKGRADSFGSYLCRILDIAEKYIVSSKPTITTNTKYELVLEQIELESAQHLSKFNLKKEYDDSKNKDARELWRTTRLRKHEPACKPNPKLTPLADIKLGDIVYLNSIDNQYKVLNKVELDGQPHIEVINVFNSERPTLVGATSYLKECYKVPSDSIQISSEFQEQEEVITEDVNVYIPKDTVKKSKALSEADFPNYPYDPADITTLEPADIITSTPYSRSFYEIRSVGKETVEAVCLFHKSLKGRVGETFTFSTPYLVEKCG